MNIKEKLWLNIEKIAFAIILCIWAMLMYSIYSEVVTPDDITSHNQTALEIQQNLLKPIQLEKSPDFSTVAAERLSPLAPQKAIVPGLAYRVFDPKPLTYSSCPPDLHNWDLVNDICLRCKASKENKLEPAVISAFNIFVQSTGFRVNAQRLAGSRNPATLLGMWVFLKKHGDEWPDKIKKLLDDSKMSREPALFMDSKLTALATPPGKRFEAAGDYVEGLIDALEPESLYDVFIVLESHYVGRDRSEDTDKKWVSLPSEIKTITTLRQSQLLIYELKDTPLKIQCRVGKFVDKDWLYADIEVVARGEKDFRDRVYDGRMRQKVDIGDTVYDFDIQRFFIGKIFDFTKVEEIEKKTDYETGKEIITKNIVRFMRAPKVAIVEERTGIEKHEPIAEFRHFEPELKKLYNDISDFIAARLAPGKDGRPSDIVAVYPIDTPNKKVNEINKLKRLKRMGFGIKIDDVDDQGFFVDTRSRDALLDLAGKHMSMNAKKDKDGHYPKNNETNKVLKYMEQVRSLGEKNNWTPARPAPGAPAPGVPATGDRRPGGR